MRAPFKIIMVIICAALMHASAAYSATINAASCSASDVQAAINSASDGDTVSIPAGSCTWTSQVKITAGITVQGAGTGETIITDKISNIPGLVLGVSSGKSYRLTGFSWINEDSNQWEQGSIEVSGTSQSVRIDHLKVTDSSGTCCAIGWWDAFGVIDHCQFIDASGTAIINLDDPNDWGGDGNGDGSWAAPLYLGTNQALYVENCDFNVGGSQPNGAVVDGAEGARIVIRYNTLTNTGVYGHGTETSARMRSFRSYEIYGNTFVHTIQNPWYAAIVIRGGSGVIYNNTYKGFQYSVTAHTYRTFMNAKFWGACDGANPYDDNNPTVFARGVYTGSSVTVYSAGSYTLTFTGENWGTNQWKGYALADTTAGAGAFIASNTSNTLTILGPQGNGNAWAFKTNDSWQIRKVNSCIDHPGAGAGLLMSGYPPVLQSTGQPGCPKEGIDGLYEWGDSSPDNSTPIGIVASTPDLKSGVDFFNAKDVVAVTAPPSGACTGGIDLDTSNGQHYLCLSGTWTEYKPYIYPHPLVSGQQTGDPTVGQSGQQTITAPSGLHLSTQ